MSARGRYLGSVTLKAWTLGNTWDEVQTPSRAQTPNWIQVVHMGVSSSSWGYPKWIVFVRENSHRSKWMMTRGSPISGNIHNIGDYTSLDILGILIIHFRWEIREPVLTRGRRDAGFELGCCWLNHAQYTSVDGFMGSILMTSRLHKTHTYDIPFDDIVPDDIYPIDDRS